MNKTYELPKIGSLGSRRVVAEFDENGIAKITEQALDSLICELNEYADRQKCENCKILELIVDFESEAICDDDDKDFEYCENNCNFKAPTKECYLHWADQAKGEPNNAN